MVEGEEEDEEDEAPLQTNRKKSRATGIRIGEPSKAPIAAVPLNSAEPQTNSVQAPNHPEQPAQTKRRKKLAFRAPRSNV